MTTPTHADQDWMEASALVRGRVIEGRWEIGDEAKGGGLSRVWRGRDRVGGEAVFLKLIAPEPETETETETERVATPREADRLPAQRGGPPRHRVSPRFLAERDALRRISHPGVVALRAAVEREDGSAVLVLPWIEAPNLRSLLVRHEPMELRRAIGIAVSLLDALDGVHAAGVVHGDVKPENVLVDRERVVLVDFGLSQRQGAPVVAAPVVAGTPAYMSPEQIQGRPLDARSDLYSWAIVLYELVAGDVPFGGTAAEIRVKQVGSRPPPPSVVSPRGDVPEEISELLFAMLAKDQAARTGSAGARAVLESRLTPP